MPGELSGGQGQRVAMARALVARPRVVFADEPTGSLDSFAADQVMELLVDTAREQGAAVLMVTHEPRVAGFADRTVLMRDGVESVQVNGVPAAAATGRRLAAGQRGEVEPSADTISWGRSRRAGGGVSRMLLLGLRLALGGGPGGPGPAGLHGGRGRRRGRDAAARVDRPECPGGQIRAHGLAGRGLLGAQPGDGRRPGGGVGRRGAVPRGERLLRRPSDDPRLSGGARGRPTRAAGAGPRARAGRGGRVAGAAAAAGVHSGR